MTMNTLAAGGGVAEAIASLFLTLFLIVVLGTAYFAPSIVAWMRHVRDIGSIIAINALFGWSIIGWGIALAMALRTAKVDPYAAGQFRDGQQP